MKLTRREAFAATLAGTAAAALPSGAVAAPAPRPLQYRRGFDNQRIPDLGNGTFLNTLMFGAIRCDDPAGPLAIHNSAPSFRPSAERY
jgi:hypothetical protein